MSLAVNLKDTDFLLKGQQLSQNQFPGDAGKASALIQHGVSDLGDESHRNDWTI